VCLTKINLTPSIVSIGNYFLSECTSLTEIDLTPLSKLESIGNHFLDRCSSLTELKCTQKQSEILKINNFMSRFKKITITDLLNKK